MFQTTNLCRPFFLENSSEQSKQIPGKDLADSNRNVYSFYFTLPYSSQTYFSLRMLENFHLYLWIAKDLSWAQNSYSPALIFGICALIWSFVLMAYAVLHRFWNELYMLIGMTLWLTANFVWMAGEVFYNDDDGVVPPSAIIFEVAIGWLLFYYTVLKPLGLLHVDKVLSKRYEEINLYPRFAIFSNWREYEHVHMLCWLGKDLSWNQDMPATWILCLIPTFLIAVDFIWVTWKSKTMTIDCAHYIAQLLWVIGNAVWAMGELFTIPGNDDDRDDPYSLWTPSSNAAKKCRWWSSVILFCAYVPIFCLYFIWLPLTYTGRIKAADIPANSHVLPTTVFDTIDAPPALHNKSIS